MINISEAFEYGIKIEVNNDYGFVKFNLDPSNVIIRKYPIIKHAPKGSVLKTNNIDMLPQLEEGETYSFNLVRPQAVAPLTCQGSVNNNILTTIIPMTLPYNSYLTYLIEDGKQFIICKKNHNNQYIPLKEFTVDSSISLQEEYVDYYTDEQLGGTISYAIGYRESDENNWQIVAEQNVKLDFEDILLTGVASSTDSTLLTLRIRYNPQISSFKTVIQEEKIDTIGSAYPFFVRNGVIGYKEIPLGGLLTYHMDEQKMFFDEEIKSYYFPANLHRTATKEKIEFLNLTAAEDFFLERKFKNRVEQWLNNGMPKILRTAAEGNFIVRLMNVSLSPMDQLGRKLHSFTATAYEFDKYENFEKYFSMLKAPTSIYNITSVSTVELNYQFQDIPYALATTQGQYIAAQAVAQMGINQITFSSEADDIAYTYNYSLNRENNKTFNITSPVLLNFSRISTEAVAVDLTGEYSKIYIGGE